MVVKITISSYWVYKEFQNSREENENFDETFFLKLSSKSYLK